MTLTNKLILFLLSFFALSGSELLAQNDSLLLTNGNLIVGEIKGMNKGVLQMKTDYSDSDFAIAWDKINALSSQTGFLMSTTEGNRYNGRLQSPLDSLSERPVEVAIINASETVTRLSLSDIVFLRTVKSDFWSKLSASVSLGYNFTKSNNFRQFSLRSTLGYQARKWSANGSYNNISSNRDEVDAVKRIDAAVSYRYFLRNDWFPLAEVNWLSNTEQNIDLRTVTKLGMGKFIKRTNQWYWGVQAGISYNNESFTDPQIPTQNSAEGFLGSEANLYDIGDLDLLASIIAYPGITESGRWRFDSNIDLQYDLPLDFFIKLGFTVNYDNRAIASDSNYDYVLQTTFGWEL